MLQQGSGSAWLFVPSAIALGALHGLEPGHSKTMMAAFIIAVRGTVAQAVLLGLSATVSHTAVVWALALVGLYFGQNSDVLARYANFLDDETEIELETEQEQEQELELYRPGLVEPCEPQLELDVIQFLRNSHFKKSSD